MGTRFQYIAFAFSFGLSAATGCSADGSPGSRVASVTVLPTSADLETGEAQQFVAEVLDSRGEAMLNHPLTWSSSNQVVATVSSTGVATALTEGDANITAMSGNGVSGTAPLSVAAPVPPGSFGPGPNSPSWAGKQVYPQELFEVPVPVIYAAPNAAGFQGQVNFPGSYGGNVIVPNKVSYPSVSTPIGVKPVFQLMFHGETTAIDAAGKVSSTYPTNQPWSVRVAGSWVGTLTFETSSDNGVTWSPFVMLGGVPGSAVTGSTTTGNGAWRSATPDNNSTGLYGGIFRVRASAWTSGTASVSVGTSGGSSPATMRAGNFTASQRRFYTRLLVYVNPTWNDNGNAGTKLFFWSQTQGNNHYINLSEPGVEGFYQVSVHMQGATNQVLTGVPEAGPAHGTWMDIELLVEAGTAGGSNGTVRLWINSVQYINSATANIFAPGTTPEFTSFQLAPTYGGGHHPPTQDQYFRIAAWYRESAP